MGAFNIGPIHKRDVIQAATMLERKKEYATILAFDVKIVPEAAQLAKEMGVRIFSRTSSTTCSTSSQRT